MRRPFAFALLATTLVALPASGSNFWETKKTKAKAEAKAEDFDDLVSKADAHTRMSEQYRALWFEAAQTRRPSRARAYLEKASESAKRAIRLYDQALELHPDDADLHYLCGKLTYTYLYERYDGAGLITMRDEAGAHAVRHWDRFEELAPDDPRRVAFVREGFSSWEETGRQPWTRGFFDPQTYQFARSIYYTKLGGTENYEKAIEDYDFLLERAPRNDRTASWIARLLTNSAEIHMAIGNLDEAVDRYAEGLDYAGSRSESLYRYGYAVALDRAGEKESAVEQMTRALQLDPKMEQLTDEGVFFIPKGDIHYYYGLAFEVLGKKTEALLHYREYVDHIENKQYVDQAKAHIERLTAGKEKKRPK